MPNIAAYSWIIVPPWKGGADYFSIIVPKIHVYSCSVVWIGIYMYLYVTKLHMQAGHQEMWKVASFTAIFYSTLKVSIKRGNILYKHLFLIFVLYLNEFSFKMNTTTICLEFVPCNYNLHVLKIVTSRWCD